MNDTSQILERLERIEAQLAPLTSSAQAIRELRDEMSPRINELVHALIVELADVESDFQLEDLLFLVKKAMRNVNNFNFTLDQLKNLIDLAKTAEPLMKTTVPQMIFYLDDLEQKGVFRLLSTSLEILKNFSAELTGEDLDQMGRGLVRLAGILKKITTPQALDLIDRAADLPGRLDLQQAEPLDPRVILAAIKDPEIRQGMGIMLALTRSLTVLRPGTQVTG